MRILLTNDDSISASQLIPLIKRCRQLGEVTTVVPKLEQSGKSHGVELRKCFEVRTVEPEPGIVIYTVDSTPADCVRFAVLGMHMEFDLVISGINCGYNMGTDILYSGTVGAVSEAAILGIKGIAISTSRVCYDRVMPHLDTVFEYLQQHRLLEKHSSYNINIPPNPTQVRITHQGGNYYTDDFVPRGNDMYEPVGRCIYENRNDLTLDTDAVKSGCISIMPLTIERTDWEAYRRLTES